MNFPFGAFADPLLEFLDLSGGEAVAFGRHIFVRIAGLDAAEELGIFWIVGNDGVIARLQFPQCDFRIIKPQPTFGFIGPMTFITGLGENRTDVAIKIDGRGQGGRSGGEKYAGNQQPDHDITDYTRASVMC